MVRDQPSQTAEAVCLMRAMDQRRPPAQRILDDPWARLFLGRLTAAALGAWRASGRLGELAERVSPGMTTWVLARHRYIDDCLRPALRGKRIRQVVLLGAGYDTRAYRFAHELAGRPVFEVDFPATSRRKARIAERHAADLPATCVVRVEIDFQTQSLPERLLESGFEKGAPTFFVWEGVSMYLTREAVKATLAAIVALGGPRTELAMDFWYLLDSPDLLSTAYRASANVLSLIGEPVTFSLHPEDAPAFLERQGLRVIEVADTSLLEERYATGRRRIHPACYLVHAAKRGAGLRSGK